MPDYTFDHLLLDLVIPLFLSLQGNLVFHGSAVTDGTKTVAFVGPSGSGKSTLAASLATSGWEAIADDALVLQGGDGRFQIAPAYPGLRLWPDSAGQLYPEGGSGDLVAHYMSKLRIVPRVLGWPPPSTPLSAVFFVQSGDELTVEPVSRRDAVVGLSSNMFQLDPADAEALAASFAKVGEFVRQVPVTRLSVPREWDRLSNVAEVVAANA